MEPWTPGTGDKGEEVQRQKEIGGLSERFPEDQMMKEKILLGAVGSSSAVKPENETATSLGFELLPIFFYLHNLQSSIRNEDGVYSLDLKNAKARMANHLNPGRLGSYGYQQVLPLY